MKLKVVDARTIDLPPMESCLICARRAKGFAIPARQIIREAIRPPLIDTLGSLGYTKSAGLPFTAEQMERHGHAGGADTRKPAHCVSGCPCHGCPRPMRKT